MSARQEATRGDSYNIGVDSTSFGGELRIQVSEVQFVLVVITFILNVFHRY